MPLNVVGETSMSTTTGPYFMIATCAGYELDTNRQIAHQTSATVHYLQRGGVIGDVDVSADVRHGRHAVRATCQGLSYDNLVLDSNISLLIL